MLINVPIAAGGIFLLQLIILFQRQGEEAIPGKILFVPALPVITGKGTGLQKKPA